MIFLILYLKEFDIGLFLFHSYNLQKHNGKKFIDRDAKTFKLNYQF